MILEQYPNEEIEAMRNMLKYEDWIDNPDLPDGWKIKPTEHQTFYMDRGGQLFNSSVRAAKFVAKYSQYFSQEDVDKINKIARLEFANSNLQCTPKNKSVNWGDVSSFNIAFVVQR